MWCSQTKTKKKEKRRISVSLRCSQRKTKKSVLIAVLINRKKRGEKRKKGEKQQRTTRRSETNLVELPHIEACVTKLVVDGTQDLNT